MYKLLLVVMLCCACAANAQTRPAAKKPGAQKKPAGIEKDSAKKEEPKVEEFKVPHEFIAYTRRSKGQKTKLCINLVNKDSALQYCINDSITRDPEVYKILYEQKKGDTSYVLVFVEAFSKPDPSKDDGRCNAGKETRLFFARWNTKTNQAKWQSKIISSCLRGTTNMTKESIDEWDKASVFTFSYHRASTFTDLKFDPEHPELGLVANKEGD